MLAHSLDLVSILQQRFGQRSFRPQQLAIIQSILAGRDCLALLPTGSGKSLCYQLPALILPGTAVVISPLITLMEDQVNQLTTRGICAAFWNHATPSALETRLIAAISDHRLQLLYLSPEKLASRRVQAALCAGWVSMVIIDEAHCISEWGNEFRPYYTRIPEFTSRLHTNSGRAPPCAAFTATADSHGVHSIATRLRLRQPQVFSLPYYRPNLQYCFPAVESEAHKRQLVLSITQHWQRQSSNQARSGLIYAGTRAGCEFWSRWLQYWGVHASAFHAGLSLARRSTLLDQYLHGQIHWLVATSAFGMGIDIPHIDTVIHTLPPLSLTEYAQKSGRAGRAGQAAQCILLYRDGDLKELLKQRNALNSRTQQRQNSAAARQFAHFANSRHCIPRLLYETFRLSDTPEPHWHTCQCSRCHPQFLWQSPLSSLWRTTSRDRE